MMLEAMPLFLQRPRERNKRCPMNDPRSSLVDLSLARAQFPGAAETIYFETSARGLLPLSARDAALTYYEARVHAVPKESGGVFEAVELARGKFARLLSAAADEVTLTRNVSEGLNILVASLPWKRGENAIVCRDIEHPNGVYTLYNMRDRHGIEVREVAPTADLAMPVESITQAIDDRTRLVIVSSVTFATGTRTDLAALGQACRARGVILLVDGAQSVGALALDVNACHIDALVVGASKYLCGPYGLGFLFVRRELAERLQPAYLARYGVDLGDTHEGEQGDGDTYRLMPGARRFDLGSYNYSAASAANASLDILAAVGVPAIEHHVLALAREMDAGLRAIGIPLVSGAVDAHRSHLVLAGMRKSSKAALNSMAQLAAHYAAQNIRVSQRHGRLRFSFHLYNTANEVQSVLDSTEHWARTANLDPLKGNS